MRLLLSRSSAFHTQKQKKCHFSIFQYFRNIFYFSPNNIESNHAKSKQNKHTLGAMATQQEQQQELDGIRYSVGLHLS